MRQVRPKNRGMAKPRVLVACVIRCSHCSPNSRFSSQRVCSLRSQGALRNRLARRTEPGNKTNQSDGILEVTTEVRSPTRHRQTGGTNSIVPVPRAPEGLLMAASSGSTLHHMWPTNQLHQCLWMPGELDFLITSTSNNTEACH